MLSSESVVLLPSSAPYAALDQLHPPPLLPQLNSSHKKAGRKRKESQPESAEAVVPRPEAAAAEPKQKRKRGRPPFKPTAVVESAPAPAAAPAPLANPTDPTSGTVVLAAGVEVV